MFGTAKAPWPRFLHPVGPGPCPLPQMFGIESKRTGVESIINWSNEWKDEMEKQTKRWNADIKEHSWGIVVVFGEGIKIRLNYWKANKTLTGERTRFLMTNETTGPERVRSTATLSRTIPRLALRGKRHRMNPDNDFKRKIYFLLQFFKFDAIFIAIFQIWSRYFRVKPEPENEKRILAGEKWNDFSGSCCKLTVTMSDQRKALSVRPITCSNQTKEEKHTGNLSYSRKSYKVPRAWIMTNFFQRNFH